MGAIQFNKKNTIVIKLNRFYLRTRSQLRQGSSNLWAGLQIEGFQE